jgi:hypothetical protein
MVVPSRLNPLGVMVAVKKFDIESVHRNIDIQGEMHHCEVNWGSKCLLMGGYQTYGLPEMRSPYVRHPPILASEGQLSLRR